VAADSPGRGNEGQLVDLTTELQLRTWKGAFIMASILTPLSSRVRAVSALVYLELAGGLGLFMMGFLGFGSLWLAATGYPGAMILGFRVGLGIVAANLALMVVAMFGFKSGVLAVPVDVNAYMRAPMVWVLALTMMVAFPWMLMNSVVHYRDAVLRLLEKTEEQRAEIQRLATHDDLTGLVAMNSC
jgi:hypothetical protein